MSEKYSRGSEKMYSREVTLNEINKYSEEIADLAANSTGWEDRVKAVAKRTGFTFSRAKTFLYGEARTVEAHEHIIAKAALRELRAKRQANEQHERLLSTITYLRETDEDFYSPTINSLEHSFSRLGVLDSAVGEPEQ